MAQSARSKSVFFAAMNSEALLWAKAYLGGTISPHWNADFPDSPRQLPGTQYHAYKETPGMIQPSSGGSGELHCCRRTVGTMKGQ